MVCKQCGAELRDGLKFCTACGCKLEAPVQPEPVPVVEEPAVPQVVIPQPEVIPEEVFQPEPDAFEEPLPAPVAAAPVYTPAAEPEPQAVPSFCPHCGQRVAPGSMFCNFCGGRMNGAAPQPVYQPVYQPPVNVYPDPQPVYQPAPAKGGRVAMILAILASAAACLGLFLPWFVVEGMADMSTAFLDMLESMSKSIKEFKTLGIDVPGEVTFMMICMYASMAFPFISLILSCCKSKLAIVTSLIPLGLMAYQLFSETEVGVLLEMVGQGLNLGIGLFLFFGGLVLNIIVSFAVRKK